MLRMILVGALSVFVAACDGNDGKLACGEHDVTWQMSNDGNTLHVTLDGNAMTLEHAISASGARYVGEQDGNVITLWNHGDEWTMFVNDGAPLYCTVK